MNIGNWIVVSFVLFALFIATLVTVCMRQDISLVSRNYYEDEIRFQEQIERQRNTNSLASKPTLAVDGRMLTLHLNQDMPVTAGTVSIFCPADARMDRTFSITPAAATQQFDLNGLNTGMYRVRFRWARHDKEYYQEAVINL
jgi:hypothetical protein